MPDPSPLLEIPRRHSLPVQAANAIRTALTAGMWQQAVPSERILCELLRVSRPTIRTALHILEKEGLVAIVPGRRNRLLASAPTTPRSDTRLVGLITHEPVTRLSLSAYQGINEMRANLAKHGFATEVLVCPAGRDAAQRRKLEEFFRQKQVFCCVLLSPGIELQQWCFDHAIPALVFGSCHPRIKLPSLDGDYRSVCRHAVGIFLAKGHRDLALIVPHSGAAGDLVSEEGFREATQSGKLAREVRATVVRHSGTAANLLGRVDALFRSPRPPTALLIAKPQHVFLVMTYLLSRGLSVPGDVSLIARDYDGFFSPLIAHYAFKGDEFVRRLSRLMLQLASDGHLSVQPHLVIPQYFPGTTVRSLA